MQNHRSKMDVIENLGLWAPVCFMSDSLFKITALDDLKIKVEKYASHPSGPLLIRCANKWRQFWPNWKKNVQYILNYGPIKDLPSQNIVNYCLLALEKYDFQYPDFTSGLQCAQTYFFGHRIWIKVSFKEWKKNNEIFERFTPYSHK